MPEEMQATPMRMTRREAVLRVSALLGGATLVGQTALLAGCAGAPAQRTGAAAGFGPDAIGLLDEIADTILPETGTPGARAAGVGPFMALMVADTYDADQQRIFRDGMAALESACRDMYGVAFMAATRAQRLALLERLDAEQFEFMRTRRADQPVHYFRMMKELALLGYFTSEIGCTRALRYVEAPGRFDSCVPYTPGERAWAAHA